MPLYTQSKGVALEQASMTSASVLESRTLIYVAALPTREGSLTACRCINYSQEHVAIALINLYMKSVS